MGYAIAPHKNNDSRGTGCHLTTCILVDTRLSISILERRGVIVTKAKQRLLRCLNLVRDRQIKA